MLVGGHALTTDVLCYLALSFSVGPRNTCVVALRLLTYAGGRRPQPLGRMS